MRRAHLFQSSRRAGLALSIAGGLAAATAFAETPSTATNAPSAPDGAYSIQILVADEERAQSYWHWLRHEHWELVRGLELEAKKTRSRGREVFRLRLGPLKTHAAAKALCRKYKAKGLECWAPPR
ncbi:MAG: SPOR domain-containing protein [Neomegalonema sp.]|nr:SPOR domain-containing protein [Neomegalonema sp.]